MFTYFINIWSLKKIHSRLKNLKTTFCDNNSSICKIIVGLLLRHDANCDKSCKRSDINGETVPTAILLEYHMVGKTFQPIRFKIYCISNRESIIFNEKCWFLVTQIALGNALANLMQMQWQAVGEQTKIYNWILWAKEHRHLKVTIANQWPPAI